MTEDERKAIVAVSRCLMGAISILEKTPQAKNAVGSDKMFNEMMATYKRALETAKAALALPSKD